MTDSANDKRSREICPLSILLCEPSSSYDRTTFEGKPAFTCRRKLGNDHVYDVIIRGFRDQDQADQYRDNYIDAEIAGISVVVEHITTNALICSPANLHKLE